MGEFTDIDVGGTVFFRVTIDGVDVTSHFARAPVIEPAMVTRPPEADPAGARRLYRKLAKMLHPDLDGSPLLGKPRTEWMALVNAAYERGDVDTLRVLAVKLAP